jgi:primosomal protein N' (replication factor Y)
MYLISVVPLTFLPRQEAELLTYFYREPLEPRTLAEAPIGAREEKVLVLGSEDVSVRKTDVRKAAFTVKGITRVFNSYDVVSREDLEFYRWLADYYYAPLGFVLRAALPGYLLTKGNVEYQHTEPRKGTAFSFSYSASPLRFASYIKKIEKNVKNQMQTLVLFPERVDAEKFYSRLPDRLKETALMWPHSSGQKKEYTARRELNLLRALTVIGTRSAVLLELPGLNTIIVEGEESDSHKSWDRYPRFDVRTVALRRAKMRAIELIWGSDVPTVRAYLYAARERVEVELPTPRDEAPLQLVDMRKEIASGNMSLLSERLREQISRLGKGKRGIFLIDRRGEYTVVLCRDCGFVLRCKQCETALITQSGEEYLSCRSCGEKKQVPDICPACKGIHFKKFGAGSQRVADEIQQAFPTLKIARLDSDVGSYGDGRVVLDSFTKGNIDVLVGTHGVVRPHSIGRAHTTGIISLETTLFLPEYDGDERAFILAKKLRLMASEAFVWQTYQPEHPLFSFFQENNIDEFLGEVASRRKHYNWPPYSQIIKLRTRGKSEKDVAAHAHFVFGKLERALPEGIEVFRPLRVGKGKVRGEVAWDMLIRVRSSVPVNVRNHFLSHVPSRWEIDVDPITLFS